MNVSSSSHNFLIIIFAKIFLIASILIVTTAHAEHNPLKSLRGQEFSNPFKQTRMPEDWKKKPLKYDPSVADADVVITLDGQMYRAWVPVINQYAKDHNLNIVTRPGTCGLSAGNLLRKSVDIGAFCCPPGETDRLPGLRFHTLGIATIALLVHPDNPLDNISIEQARQIFQGEIYRWSDLITSDSGKKTSLLIQPVGRLHCKLRPGHWRLLLDNEDLFSVALVEVGAIPDMISQVAINPAAIGYEVLWMARYYQDKGKVKILKINGLDPDEPSHLVSNKYPLYRVYSFSTWEGKNVENPHARKLVHHLLQQSEHLDRKFSIVPPSSLRKAGWKFRDTELVGEPGE